MSLNCCSISIANYCTIKKSHKSKKTFECGYCKIVFEVIEDYLNHIQVEHIDKRENAEIEISCNSLQNSKECEFKTCDGKFLVTHIKGVQFKTEDF